MSSNYILEINNISKYFGGLRALNNVSVKLAQGEILGLIGPNGAGKTTLFNIIAGALQPNTGNVLFKGEDITKKRPDQRCHAGIARTFQIVQSFDSLNLVENVAVGSYFGKKSSEFSSTKEKAKEILKFVGLDNIMYSEAINLSYGNRKKLELARALATEPEVLLLDEVIGGLTPTEANEVIEIINNIRDRGISIIMIEHVMKAVMGASDRMVVLNYGEILARGTPSEIANNDEVIEAYLGGIKNA